MVKGLDFVLNINSEQFTAYMHEAPVGYMLIDKFGKIVEVNQLLLRASLFKESELIDHSFHHFIHFDGSTEDFITNIVNQSSNSLSRITWQDAEGTIRYSKIFVWTTESEPKIYAIAFLDIHKEKHLSLISRFAENFVSESNIGIIVIDHKFNITEISQLACKLLNVTRNEILNQSGEDLFLGVPDEQRIIKRSLLDGVTLTNHAITWSINQQRYDLLIDSNIIKDNKDTIVGAYVVFKDVTNLRSLEQQVRQNDRLATIGQIAAGTAHEIRNPLTSIKGFLQILKGVFNDSKMSHELQYTDIMLSEIDRINKLLNEILLLSKPKNVVYEPLDINSLLREMMFIIENEGILYSIGVEFDPDPTIPLVIGSSELLKQVFLNIAKNGIEAMSDGGKLTISTRANEELKQVVISIHDSGPGIPNYFIDKIFEPFFTTKDTGTGLGLSICQKIIHDLGGSIRVSTKGFGTTFQVSLPFH